MRPALALALALLVACNNDDEQPADKTGAETVSFTITVENVGEAFAYHSSGAFMIPDGASEAGPAGPGGAYTFTFPAVPGDKLSFATMFAQSNDLFYAPDPAGLELFDDNGDPWTGDRTDEIELWDAGTEVNQAVGEGADQAPRQAGADTGAADSDDTVRLADDIGVDVDDIVLFELDYADGWFTATLSNASSAGALVGGTVDAPITPGPWFVHTDAAALFEEGEIAADNGLEALAEDGDPSGLVDWLDSVTGLTSPIAPGVWALSDDGTGLFAVGDAASPGLEILAEDGDPSALADETDLDAGIFDERTQDYSVGAIGPGESYRVTIEATDGQTLSLAAMLAQSNDIFIGAEAIDLFPGGEPLDGDVSDQLELWDAGTETNQFPGAGADQAPRQAGPGTGEDEGGVVATVDDGYDYPDLTDLIRVTITPK